MAPTALMRLAVVTASAAAYLAAFRAKKLVVRSPQAEALVMLQSWSRHTCKTLGVNVRVHGALPAGYCVYVANHRSYLDIPVLASVLPATFLSNDDVATWPVVGAAAAEVGAVFVDRSDMQGRIRALRQIARSLQRNSIIVFPEGTTNGGQLPAEFHDGLFRFLPRLRAAAVPVTLRYSDRRAYWVEEIGIGEHLRRHVLSAPLSVDVHVGAPIIAADGVDGDGLAAAVYAAVAAPIEIHGELADSFMPQP